MNKDELIKAIKILLRGYYEQDECDQPVYLECGIDKDWQIYCREL